MSLFKVTVASASGLQPLSIPCSCLESAEFVSQCLTRFFPSASIRSEEESILPVPRLRTRSSAQQREPVLSDRFAELELDLFPSCA